MSDEEGNESAYTYATFGAGRRKKPAMTEPFDWADLSHEAASIRYTHGDPAAAAYLRERIEAAFVPVGAFNAAQELIAAWEKSSVQATARAEAAEAENARLREALTRLRDCDWVITLPDRMDAVRDIARQALGAEHGKR